MPIVLSALMLMSGLDPDPLARDPRVRGVSIHETRLIAELLACSETARALVAAIEASDLIVYVQFTPEQPAGRGATRLAVASPVYRYLRIVLGARTHPKDRPSLLAHELQHAVEIARAPEVRDDEGLRRLYGEIGEDPHARTGFETTAARDVAARVQREMGNPKSQVPNPGSQSPIPSPNPNP